MNDGWWRACIAELIGTFSLVFIGAGAIVTNSYTEGGVGLIGIALAHGLVLSVMVSATGHISGGHINPAVTFAAMITGRIGVGLGGLYAVFQLAGGVIAGYLLRAIFPVRVWDPVNLGTPGLDTGVSFGIGVLVEAILTFFLVFVIFGVAMDERGPKAIASFAIGLVLTLDILVGGPLTGASMNPARTFGPAAAAGFWTDHSVYWVGPLVGGGVAALVYHFLLRVSNKTGAGDIQ
ncbi:MAG: MIP/aquaporin family protein [Candidatus Bipolaricaulia bacterium]